eukprot:g5194.t1
MRPNMAATSKNATSILKTAGSKADKERLGVAAAGGKILTPVRRSARLAKGTPYAGCGAGGSLKLSGAGSTPYHKLSAAESAAASAAAAADDEDHGDGDAVEERAAAAELASAAVRAKLEATGYSYRPNLPAESLLEQEDGAVSPASSSATNSSMTSLSSKDDESVGAAATTAAAGAADRAAANLEELDDEDEVEAEQEREQLRLMMMQEEGSSNDGGDRGEDNDEEDDDDDDAMAAAAGGSGRNVRFAGDEAVATAENKKRKKEAIRKGTPYPLRSRKRAEEEENDDDDNDKEQQEQQQGGGGKRRRRSPRHSPGQEREGAGAVATGSMGPPAAQSRGSKKAKKVTQAVNSPYPAHLRRSSRLDRSQTPAHIREDMERMLEN